MSYFLEDKFRGKKREKEERKKEEETTSVSGQSVQDLLFTTGSQAETPRRPLERRVLTALGGGGRRWPRAPLTSMRRSCCRGAFVSLHVCARVGETCTLSAAYWPKPQAQLWRHLCFCKATAPLLSPCAPAPPLRLRMLCLSSWCRGMPQAKKQQGWWWQALGPEPWHVCILSVWLPCWPRSIHLLVKWLP